MRIVIALAVLLTGCGNSEYDPDLCDFYQSLGVGYEQSQGYVPADVLETTDQHCTR